MELIERIERGTLAAVSPQVVEELPGWLLPMDPGTVGRSHSAVPVHHRPPALDVLNAIAARYASAGWTPVLRLPDLPQWGQAHAYLQSQGWTRGKPTCVMTAEMQTLCERTTTVLPEGATVAMAERADAQWMGLFLGEGLDPVDGASRSQALARSSVTRFGGVTVAGAMVACGAVCFSHGLVSAHGLRTALTHRGRGLATALLGAMAREAQLQGLEQGFLQVEATNPARHLYERLGYSLAWQYAYWKPR